jgi:hypothetical protein
MTPSQLNRAVARVTGESIATIRQRGFSIVDIPTGDDPSEPVTPQFVDWETADERRVSLFPSGVSLAEFTPASPSLLENSG